jgi:hypothetical protein
MYDGWGVAIPHIGKFYLGKQSKTDGRVSFHLNTLKGSAAGSKTTSTSDALNTTIQLQVQVMH